MKVPFVSFEPMHNEIEDEIKEVFNDIYSKNIFINGNYCKKFEHDFSEYCGTQYCVGTGTGLDSIYIILKALGIGKGDEVIIPSNTYIATALAVTYAGADVVMVEPDITTYNIDCNLIEEKITKKTKAIIAVHLQGRMADMDKICAIGQKYGLYIIEDAAQAHGATYKGMKPGNMSMAAAFSFYPGKNLGALGDGGCIVTNNKELADKCRAIGNYGSDYKYHHIYLGNNSRLDELQAGFLSVKLKYLDKWNQFRRNVAQKYFDGINNNKIIMPLKSNDEYEHIYHIFAIRCEKRDELEKYLNENGIGTVKHYPIPIHKQEAYRNSKISKESYEISEHISDTILSIPMYYGISEEQIEYVIDMLNRFDA